MCRRQSIARRDQGFFNGDHSDESLLPLFRLAALVELILSEQCDLQVGLEMKTKSKLVLLFLVADVAVTCSVTLPYSSPCASDDRKQGYFFTFAQITDSQFSGSSAISEKVTT